MLIHIDCGPSAGDLPHFWRATGFTPGNALLQTDMQVNMAFVGALPRRGIEHVRIHSLLDLVKHEGGDRYDFASLDSALDVLRGNGLRPFFELMGNPSERFSDFTDAGQLDAWRGLVAQVAGRCAQRYGRDETRRWYWETWNEPDCPTWWGQFMRQPVALCHYYDACRAGLDAVDPALRLGGPGGQGNLNPTTHAFLKHCGEGHNRFTGQPVRLDFISFHEKGAPMTPEHVEPDLEGMLARERRYVAHVRGQHPRLANVPVMNGEADPQIGWFSPHSWHATAFYPAWVARSVIRHLTEFVLTATPPYELLLNDNGFLGGWGHRTLICDLTKLGAPPFNTHSVDPIKKPVYNLMAMLAHLGPRRLGTSIANGPDERVLTLASQHDDGSIAVLLCTGGSQTAGGPIQPVTLRLHGLANRFHTLAHWTIDDQPGSVYHTWAHSGAPQHPKEETVLALHANQEPLLHGWATPVAAREGVLNLPLAMADPSVHLLLLSPFPRGGAGEQHPEDTPAPTLSRLRGLRDEPRTLVRWPSAEVTPGALFTVQRRGGGRDWQTLNPRPTLSSVAVDPRPLDHPADYRVLQHTPDGRVVACSAPAPCSPS